MPNAVQAALGRGKTVSYITVFERMNTYIL
jgi:hypothetical protein